MKYIIAVLALVVSFNASAALAVSETPVMDSVHTTPSAEKNLKPSSNIVYYTPASSVSSVDSIKNDSSRSATVFYIIIFFILVVALIAWIIDAVFDYVYLRD